MKREIISIDIKLTNLCNLNCIMCGQRIRKEGIFSKKFIDIELIKKFFKDMPKNLKVYLWGGEPLLHPDFKEIVKFFVSRKSKVIVNTNAYILDQYINFFVKNPIETLIISLDGLYETHDLIRRKTGVFNTVKKALLKYIDEMRKLNKKNTVINFTVLPENYLQMESFCTEVKSWDIYAVTMNFLILVDNKAGTKFRKDITAKYKKDISSWLGYSGNYTNKFNYKKLSDICNKVINEHGYFIRWSNENFCIDEENLKTYYEKPDAMLENIIPLTCNPINKPCSKIKDSIVVDYNGNIVICPDFPDTIIGNIKQNKFEDFYDKEIYDKYGLDKEYKAICYRCRHRS